MLEVAIQPIVSTDGLSVLLNIIDNHAADALTRRAEQATKKSKLTANAVVIRMHSVAMEKEAIDVRASRSPRPNDKDSPVGEPELLGIALMLYEACHEAWSAFIAEQHWMVERIGAQVGWEINQTPRHIEYW